MKKNTKITLSLLLLFLFIFSTVFYFSKRCVLDGQTICYDEKLSQFKIEVEGTITVQVESEAIKETFMSVWEKQHPDEVDRVEIIVQAPLTIKEILEYPSQDIIYTSQNNAAYFMDRFYDLGDDFKSVVGSKIPQQLQDAMNTNGFNFVQNTINGWVFIYNKTLMSELGYNTDDINKDGLPDEFESWEKILSHSNELLDNLDYVFPLTFSDQYSFYPFLTGGRWTLNFNHSMSEFGFKSREFLEGLELIEAFSKVALSKNDDNADSLKWAYDTALYERQTLFSISHASLGYEEQLSKHQDEFIISPFPKFKDYHLSPSGEVNGYALQNKTETPSLAAEVLRVLRSPDVLNHYESSDDKTIIYHRSHLDELNVSEEMKQLIKSYNYHDTDSVLALENNPSVLLRSVYEEVNFMDIFKDLYDGKISKEEAQNAVVERAEMWLKDNGGVIDDDVEGNS
ncbi:MAG TPA: ABC transporter substrate-binding protein [Erysipelothrix sp.]